MFQEIPWEDYRAIPAVNQSLLRCMRVCPAKAKDYLDGKLTETRGQKLGSLNHLVLLEPERFDERYVIQHEPCLTTKGEIASNPRSTKHWARRWRRGS